jgi:hypothetical protein
MNTNASNVKINPYAKDAKVMKTRKVTTPGLDLSDYPNFHKSGSIKGMKNLYYGKGALLVRQGDYIYNVTSSPDIYYQHAV